MTVHRHAAFGCTWDADLPLAAFDRWDEARDAAAGLVTVRRVDTLATRTPVRADAVFADGLRVAWYDEASFDVYDGTRIDYCPGPHWTGTMPVAFGSTVAALTLAWRGALPLHASAVELGGRAVLIAGTGGAGKSTLAAELLRHGASLIGDDLSVLTRASPDERFAVERGRPAIRLHPDAAARLPALSSAPVPGDDRGKWLVRPVARSRHGVLPIAGFVMLGAPDGPLSRQEATVLLGQHLFRPRWQRLLPGHADRLRAVFALAAQVPCHGLTATGPLHADAATLDRARRLVEAMVAA